MRGRERRFDFGGSKLRRQVLDRALPEPGRAWIVDVDEAVALKEGCEARVAELGRDGAVGSSVRLDDQGWRFRGAVARAGLELVRRGEDEFRRRVPWERQNRVGRALKRMRDCADLG